jgi:hypothetical protein
MRNLLLLLGLIFIVSACSKPPAVAPGTRQTIWTDIISHSDTIITNLDNQPPLIYFAKSNWQLSADTNLTHGYRFIGILYKDSILVKGLNDPSTNYQGPFLLETNKAYDTLKAQNFLDITNANPVTTYTHGN